MLDTNVSTSASTSTSTTTSRVIPEALRQCTDREMVTKGFITFAKETKFAHQQPFHIRTTSAVDHTPFVPEMDVDITKKENCVNIAMLKENADKVLISGRLGARAVCVQNLKWF